MIEKRGEEIVSTSTSDECLSAVSTMLTPPTRAGNIAGPQRISSSIALYSDHSSPRFGQSIFHSESPSQADADPQVSYVLNGLPCFGLQKQAVTMRNGLLCTIQRGLSKKPVQVPLSCTIRRSIVS